MWVRYAGRSWVLFWIPIGFDHEYSRTLGAAGVQLGLNEHFRKVRIDLPNSSEAKQPKPSNLKYVNRHFLDRIRPFPQTYLGT